MKLDEEDLVEAEDTETEGWPLCAAPAAVLAWPDAVAGAAGVRS
jgi:hypothetical protein